MAIAIVSLLLRFMADPFLRVVDELYLPRRLGEDVHVLLSDSVRGTNLTASGPSSHWGCVGPLWEPIRRRVNSRSDDLVTALSTNSGRSACCHGCATSDTRVDGLGDTNVYWRNRRDGGIS